MTFSRALRLSSSWNDWNTKPTCSARRAARWSSSRLPRDWPARITSPRLGRSSPASRLSRVDLPEPEAPTMATLAPRAISRLTSSRMVSLASGASTTLLRWRAVITLSDMGSALMNVWKKCATGVFLYLLALPALAQNILLVGDSISAAFGLEIEQGWVTLLEQRLAEQDYPHAVINASVSGDTTAGGLARLPGLLQEFQPELVVIELGGNDGLRALPVSNMQQNLSAMVELAQDAGADVILLGMRIPPNYGPRYSNAFENTFVEVAAKHEVALLPFLLE